MVAKILKMSSFYILGGLLYIPLQFPKNDFCDSQIEKCWLSLTACSGDKDRVEVVTELSDVYRLTKELNYSTFSADCSQQKMLQSSNIYFVGAWFWKIFVFVNAIVIKKVGFFSLNLFLLLFLVFIS